MFTKVTVKYPCYVCTTIGISDMLQTHMKLDWDITKFEDTKIVIGSSESKKER